MRSEGFIAISYLNYPLQYNTNSDGCEGKIERGQYGYRLQNSILSHGSEGACQFLFCRCRLQHSAILDGSKGKGIVKYGLWFSVISFVVWRCDWCILLFSCKYFQTISDER